MSREASVLDLDALTRMRHDEWCATKLDESPDCDCIRQTVLALVDLARLGAAWAAVEVALPEGWVLETRGPWDGPRWMARARCLHDDNCHSITEDGPTPAAALLALAEKLVQR